MQRVCLRLAFNRLEGTLYFVKNLKDFFHSLIKPVLYKKKMKKVLEINRRKLEKKQNIFNSKIVRKNAKAMNFVR